MLGKGTLEGYIGQVSQFSVSTYDAYENKITVGGASISVTVDGPQKVNPVISDLLTGEYDIKYLPTKPGQFTIAVTYSGVHAPNSPLTVTIKDTNAPEE
jgi:hypothetical protein